MKTYQIILINEITESIVKPVEHFKTDDIDKLSERLIELQKTICNDPSEAPIVEKISYKSDIFYIECLAAKSKSELRYTAPLRTITKEEALNNYKN